MGNSKIINKTMDFNDLKDNDLKKIISEINTLIINLRRQNLKISSWEGKFNLTGNLASTERISRGYNYRAIDDSVDDINFPWFLYWEIAWVVLNNNFKANDLVLDLGGSSSLFSFYLASKGIEVTTVDLNKELVDNANYVARKTGWKLKNYVMDMRKMIFNMKFDHVTSICVYEHIPYNDRMIINRKIKDLLIDGGHFSITFDYANPSKFARIGSPQDVYEQFIATSGLKLRGNSNFFDNGIRYLLHPFYYNKRLWRFKLSSIKNGDFSPWEIFRVKKSNDYTFGALFLEKQ